MNLRHITRFTYEFTNFQGWRVAISRQGTTLARYFSDKQYGSPEEARAQAISFRDMVLEEISRNPDMTREILYQYRVSDRKKGASAPSTSLRQAPFTAEKITAPADSSGRCSQAALTNLKKLCHYLQLDALGMMRLSLYLFMAQYGTAAAIPQTNRNTVQQTSAITSDHALVSESQLQRVIDLLEGNATAANLHGNPNNDTDLSTTSSQVPDEEIRAKESTRIMRNTSPPDNNQSPDNEASPPMHRRPARSSPSEPRSVLPATDTPQHPHPQKEILPPFYTTSGTARSIDHHRPKRIDQGLEYAVPRPPNAI